MARFLITSLFVAALSAGPAMASPIPADIVFVLDNTYSMEGKLPLVKSRLAEFNAAMLANNVDPQYALVKFGYLEYVMADMGPFANLAGPLAELHGHSDNPEDGSVAVVVAMTDVTFRPGALRNIILITDEDDDSSLAEFTAADTILGSTDAFFNFIGNLGEGNTDTRYGVLAGNHRGTAFDINDFVADPDTFFTDFINVKLAEITAPEPVSMTILLAGSLLVLRRRR